MIYAIHLDLAKFATVWHQTGKNDLALAQELYASQPNFKAVEHVSNMSELMRASDAVLTRAGITTISELAATQAATIVVPSPILADGHQLKNAELLEKRGAVITVKQGDAQDLLDAIKNVLADKGLNDRLRTSIAQIQKNDASREVAKIIIQNLKT